MSGIYIHIPFCSKACHYCDFHFTTSLTLKDKMIAAIVKEIETSSFLDKKTEVSTIYFGGGTPSLLSQTDLALILDTLHKNFNIDPETEITIECNPENVNKLITDEWKILGFNRISLGIQSFDDSILRWMNRAHNTKDALTALHDLSNCFENISCDLIFGSAHHTIGILKKDVGLLTSFPIKHLSVYNLTIEEKTAFGRMKKNGELRETNENDVIDQFYFLIDMLPEKGFGQYEISNYAQKNFESRHNSNYWKNVPYTGYGPSAHSYNGTERRFNISNNARYIHAITNDEICYENEFLSEKDHFNEYILTSLRTRWGVNLRKYPRFFDDKKKIIDHYKKSKDLEEVKETLYLTRKGKLISDTITESLFN